MAKIEITDEEKITLPSNLTLSKILLINIGYFGIKNLGQDETIIKISYSAQTKRVLKNFTKLVLNSS